MLGHEEANGYVLEVKRIGPDLGDGRSRVLYVSIEDVDTRAGHDLDYYRQKLQTLGLVVPESMFEEVQEDAAHSNRCAQHFHDGRIIEGVD
jgi:hypothetical protein